MIYDFVILGAGAAGITLALDLSKKNKDVSIALVEAGGLDWSEKSQNLYNVKYSNLDSNDLYNLRLRYFGGTTNHWGGYCRPLDNEDFINRPEIKRVGWPIDKITLDKYLYDSIQILDCNSSLKVRDNRSSSEKKILDDLELEETEWIYSYAEIFRNKFDDIKNSKNIKLLLNKTAFNINEVKENNIVNKINIIDTINKKISVLNGKNFIISMGGVESTRFLMNCNRVGNYNFGNISKNLGKGFMDHPHMTIGQYIGFKNFYYGNNRRYMRFFKPTFEFQQKNKILNTTLRIGKDDQFNNKLVKEFNTFYKLKNQSIDHTGYVHINSEQELRNQNQITLTNEYDDLNIPIINLDFSYSQLDLKTFRMGANLAANYFINTNYGRLKLEKWIYDEDSIIPFDDFRYYGHHMGSMRMSNNINDGVVDQSLKVYGTKNLYVASSSIFPTGGISNPTLTIVQLSLYLSNLLSNQYNI